ncbi:hypothetical protein AMATHDRAFT_52940 [Amanita thiersii Skay4041]|uniref:Rap1 Myb domain-containing protein n=1 Tax=Amanita thiersii Skay4041 TaxID=703135 RepID=A0A2A9NT20_9AGAR|nr:hypothetical protein AMATHDRAFT_52940 [Amanita thiersii Skay4041]
MAGNARSRRAFTESDEENFCHFMAIKIPDMSAGGRMGHKIYERLMDLPLVDPENFGWVNRHTQHSWRGHYKNNRERLDKTINELVLLENPTEKQLFEYDRRLSRRNLAGSGSDQPRSAERAEHEHLQYFSSS